MARVKLIESVIIHSGVVSLRKDRFSLDGKVIEKDIVEHQPSVGIVPIIDRKFVLLVSQYRRAAETSLLEIPAGKIEEGETAKQAATQAKRTERPVTLEPMPSYERRVVHAYIQNNFQDVVSESVGNDPRRRIVIKKSSR